MKLTKLNQSAVALGAFVLFQANPMMAADLHVPADHATIQAAVNAATAGDTIHIGPGIYREQTWITEKNLTLVGQPGTILRAFPGMQPGLAGVANWRCIIFISASANVVIRDLTFEGDQVADQNERGLVGVLFDLSGGAVENCRFTGFREGTPGSTEALAIYFVNDLSNAKLYQARVVGNTIEDSYEGIDVDGAANKISYNVTIENNTIRGVGPTSASAEPSRRGIHLQNGVTGAVTGNSISDFAYDGVGAENPFGFGIIAIGANDSLVEYIRFENNTFRNNNLHMVLIRANQHDVVNNRFEGTAPGQRSVGLWFTGEDVKVQGNVFLNTADGTRVGGVDPDFGDFLGFANNAELSNNRFCGVNSVVEVQTAATASEQGTLTCPFPDPELNIAGAVLLSWPQVEEGFIVECASTPDGPWTTADATKFVQDGSHAVSVPATGDQKYFRLVKP